MKGRPARHPRPQGIRGHRGFYVHRDVFFVPGDAAVAVIDVVGGTGMWAHWVGLGWGLGLAFHAYSAFVLKPREMARWEQEQIAKAAR